jgi:hypothetical protein
VLALRAVGFQALQACLYVNDGRQLSRNVGLGCDRMQAGPFALVLNELKRAGDFKNVFPF